jgi:type 1 glutamine amidotransferase
MRTFAGLLALSCVATAFAADPQFKKVRLTEAFLSEGATYGDFNKDGKTDVASGPYWYEGPAFAARHEFMPVNKWDPAKEYSNAFLMFNGDFNADGWTDIFVVGFPTKDARWYENPAGKGGSHWAEHYVIKDHLDNESPLLTDLFKDGKPALVSNVGGVMGFLTADPADATAAWKFHAVSGPNQYPPSFTHGVGVGDVNGDGRDDILAHKGWYEQPEKRDDAKPWAFHPVDFGPGGAQMLVYDVDADGKNDVITSLQAHHYGIAWFKQVDGGKFEKNLFVGTPTEKGSTGVVFSQPHALALADVDGDGVMDVVTGKRRFAHGDHGDPEPMAKPVTYWFQLTRDGGVTWTPHLIDDNTGVGTQVTAADINNDEKVDVLVGNKMGTTVFLQLAAGASPVPGGGAAADEEDQSHRKVLVFSMTMGFKHSSIPVGQRTMKQLGERSKAFTAVVSDDLSNFDAERLKEFSAVIFLNTTLEIPLSDAQKTAFMDAIKSGQLGFVGIHSATDTFYKWPEYGEMIGGHFDGHPWTADKTVTIRREKENAITTPFPPEFQLTEEIYQMKDYERPKCDVHFSLNTAKTDMTLPGIKRKDGDYAVCWIKNHGKGRVFYTSMGHNEAVYQREDYQNHVLAGIRWVLGDIQIDVEPHHLPEPK